MCHGSGRLRLVVDTGIYGASLSRRRRSHVARLTGQQVFLASVTVSELRDVALVADWGPLRRQQLESAPQTITVIPIGDGLLTTMAELRCACRSADHPLHEHARTYDLWIAASALHIGAPLLTADNVLEQAPGSPFADHGECRVDDRLTTGGRGGT